MMQEIAKLTKEREIILELIKKERALLEKEKERFSNEKERFSNEGRYSLRKR